MNLETEVLFYRIKKNYKNAEKKYKELKKSYIHKWNEVDGLYRVYHQSLKMYYELKKAINDYLCVFLELIGEKKKKTEHIEEKVERINLDTYFTKTLKEAMKLKFFSNEKRIWHEHQKKLTSALYHSKIAVNSVMNVAKKYVEKDRLPGENGVLNIDDSIFVEMLNLEDYRFTSIKKLKERIRAYRKSKDI